ncbi:glucose PTS transporter subunit EIIB, partial [Acerihabitans sp.]|uniref:glucose PTS transporter subunit EIIB n=1 Tax=Acerihabitans sp. TaxID=2811394 RepID=UPI002EDB5D47
AAAGGASNINSIDACISRLRLTVIDATLVNDAAAKRLGAVGVIRPNRNSAQLIVGTAAESIADAMKQVIASGGGR